MREAEVPEADSERHVDVAGAYYEHARWLIEWHNRRNDAFISRSIGLLGFVGVVFVLLTNGVVSQAEVYRLDGVRISAAAVAVLLLTAGFLCIRVIGTRQSVSPSIEELRSNWHKFMFDPSGLDARVQFAEDLLHGQELLTDNPVTAAQTEADSRARSFEQASRTAFVALVALTIHFGQLVLRS